jgi:hypothetical protein
LRHASRQALKDAIDGSRLLFESVPDAECAQIRVYRLAQGSALELIIFGRLRRHGDSFRHVHSLVMRAKLPGIQFTMTDEILSPLGSEE